MKSPQGKASTSTIVVSVVALVACVGAGYTIAKQTGGEQDVQQAAAASSQEQTPATTASPSPSSSDPAPTTTAGPTKVSVEPSTPSASATPTKVGIAGSDSGAASSRASSSRWTSPAPYTRPPVSVVSTTVPLPPEVLNAQGGHIVGREEDDKQTPSTVPTSPETAAAEEKGGNDGQVPIGNVAGDRDASNDVRPVADQEQQDRKLEAARAETDSPTGENQSRPAPTPNPAPVAEPAPAPAPVAEPAPAPVSEAEIDAALRSAFTPGAGDAQLAAAFESGPAMAPVGRALADGLPLLGGAVQWHLAGVTGTGDQATGQLVVTTPLGQQVVPMTWVRQAGQWKISTDTSCGLGFALLGGCAPA